MYSTSVEWIASLLLWVRVARLGARCGCERYRVCSACFLMRDSLERRDVVTRSVRAS